MAKEGIRRIFLGNWPITHRLTLGFLLAALIAGAAAGAAGLAHAQVLGNEAQLYRQILASNRYLDIADFNLLLLDPTVHNAIADAQSNNANDLAVVKQSLQVMETQLTEALQRYQQEDLLRGQPQAQQVLTDAGQNSLIVEQEQLFASAQRTWAVYQQAQDQVVSLLSSGQVSQAADYEQRQTEPTHSDAVSALNSLAQLNRQLADAVQVGISQEDQQGTLMSVLAAALAVIAVLIVGWLISHSISGPLHHLHRLTQSVARGRLDSRAQPMTSDEIGSVTQAVNGMLDTIVGLLYETQNQRDTLANHAERLEGSVRGAGAGDLRVRAEESGDAVGRLASAFNLTFNRFRRFISGSQATIQHMDAITRQVGERSSMLSRQARLEAARYTHLSGVATDLAEQMRQGQAGINESIQHWQMVAEALESGKVTTKRAIETVRGTRLLSSPAHTTAAALAQRAESLEDAVNLTEDVARRAARMVLTTEVQTGPMMERLPGLRMVAEELRSLSERATEAAHQMADAVSDTRLVLQDAAAEITVTSQARAEMMESGMGMVNNIDKILQATESTLAAHGQRLNQVRTVISHAQVAEEISRALQESGMFLHTAGAEAQKIAQATEQLVQLDQHLLASLAPFKLPEPSGRLPNMSNMMLDERSAVSSAKKPPN